MTAQQAKTEDIVETLDGSHTLYSKRFKEHYHSTNGAVSESNHIFIEAGLKAIASKDNTIRIFEVGFGTGLNAVLTLEYAIKENLKIVYHSIEKYPIEADSFDFNAFSCDKFYNKERLKKLHYLSWEESHKIGTETFEIVKINNNLLEFIGDRENNSSPFFYCNSEFYDIVFFDAFSPETQPEMWSLEIMSAMFESITKGGILVTYCAKGWVRRELVKAGFLVEKLPGPKGKREILRAIKV